MSVKRSRPGSHAVRKGRNIGPDYPERNFANPFDGGIDHELVSTDSKTLDSPSGSTVSGADAPIHKGTYDKLWDEGR